MIRKNAPLIIFLLFISLTFLEANAENLNFATKGFEKNLGQIIDEEGNKRPDVHFSTFHNGYMIFFTNQGIVYYHKHSKESEITKIKTLKIPNPYSDIEWKDIQESIANETYKGTNNVDTTFMYRFDVKIINSNLSNPVGEGELFEKRNYYTPQFTDGLMGVPLFSKIKYSNIYNNIDLVFYFKDNTLKYDFIVNPEADISQIKLLYQGVRSTQLTEDGKLEINVIPGSFYENKPISFQNSKVIETNYKIDNDTISFKFESKYDITQPITIDPELIWSTYFENNYSSLTNYWTNPVWDTDGNMFIAASISSQTFPVINPGGATYYQATNPNTGSSVVIMKFNSNRQIIWSTYYKGTSNTRVGYYGRCLAIDSQNNFYLTGSVTNSSTAPYTTNLPLQDLGGGAYYQNASRNESPFILKFNSNGTRLWATLFAAAVDGTRSNNLTINCLTIGPNDKIYITGTQYPHTSSSSWGMPPLVNPGGSAYFRNAPVESQTAYFAVFSSSGVLEWGTYISQSIANSYHQGYNCTVDNNGNLFVCGSAGQVFSQAPTQTPYTLVNPGGGAYQDGLNSGTTNGRKIAIHKFNTSRQMVWCTLYGGRTSTNSVLWQDPYDCIIAPSGDLYVVGRTNTTDFPTHNPGGGAFFKGTLSTGGTSVCDGVILRFSNGGVRQWATYYGGNGTSDGSDLQGIVVDESGNIFVSGYSRSTSMPQQSLTGSYNQATQTGSGSIILAQFSATNARIWGTYFGNNITGGLQWRAGFGGRKEGCGMRLFQTGYLQNSATSLPATINPGGGAYFLATQASGSYSDIFLEFNNQKNPIALANNNDSKTCPCSGNYYTHFIPSSTDRIIASINPNGQNLGNTTVTAYVQAAAIIVNDCNTTSPNFQTAVMGRRFKITPTTQPSSNVNIRLYFSQTEFTNLHNGSITNTNPNDNISSTTAYNELKATRFSASAGNLTYENGNFPDNCGRGNFYLYNNTGTGNVTSLFTGFDVNGRYAEFSVPGFSEMWLHGKTDNSPLPVELLSFSAACLENSVRINWSTVSEQNNAYFQIEKSKDGIEWELIKRISGAGNSNSFQQYETFDDNPINGNSLYRLSQIDYDGTITYFEPYNVTCKSASSKIDIYPNPAIESTQISIHTTENVTNAQLQITDATGKTIYNETIHLSNGINNFTIPTESWPDGIYFVRIIHEQLTLPTKKLLIRK